MTSSPSSSLQAIPGAPADAGDPSEGAPSVGESACSCLRIVNDVEGDAQEGELASFFNNWARCITNVVDELGLVRLWVRKMHQVSERVHRLLDVERSLAHA